MTIQEALELGKKTLSDFDEGILESRLLLEFVLSCNYNHIMIHKDQVLSHEESDSYRSFLQARLTHKPISQIMGVHEFYGYEFKVNEFTLIPRQETEMLVELVISKIDAKEKLICDLGTGTACIPISICLEKEHVSAIALDVSKEALAVARYNIDHHKLGHRITSIESDLFSALGDQYYNCVDIMISNPPYIPTKDVESLDKQVKHYEPKLALDGGEDGLDFYRSISKEAINYLRDGGIIVYEIGHDQSEPVSDILKDNGYVNISVLQDLHGVNRIVYAALNKS